MIKYKGNILFIVLFVMSMLPHRCYSYLEETHKVLNEAVIESKLVALDDYLNKQWGFTDGIATLVKGKSLLYWLKQGGEDEDSPLWRSFRHYLDASWFSLDNAGLFKRYPTASQWAFDLGDVQEQVL